MNSKKPIIAIIIDQYHPFQAAVIDKISSDLQAANYASICVTGREIHPPGAPIAPYAICNAVYPQLNDWDISGIICLTGAIGQNVDTSTIQNFVDQFDAPIVSVGMELPGTMSVFLDQAQGMHQLMLHLLENRSRRQFAFISGHDNDIFSLERKQVFIDSLTTAGFDESQLHFLSGHYDPFETYEKVSELLAKQDIDCIVAANDVMAASAARAAKAAGLAIPHDIAVCGFDDTPESTGHSPALTTVRQPIARIGQEAVQLLLQRIEENELEDVGETSIVCLPTELVIRRSTQSEGIQNSAPTVIDQSLLLKEIQVRMNGLESPESVSYAHISQMLIDAFHHGSTDIMHFANEVSARTIAEHSHWWLNLAEHILSITDELSTQSDLIQHSAIVISAVSAMKEKIWSFEMDNQFETLRLQNERSEHLLNLSSCNNSIELLRTMDKWLKTMNPTRCFVVRYKNRGKQPHQRAELIYAYRNDKTEKFGVNEFNTQDILPVDFHEELNRGTLILNPLYSDHNLYGYLLVDPTNLNLIYTEEAGQSIGNAMRTHFNIEALKEQTNSLEQANFELAHLANYDALTGLANRLKFQQYLEDFCDGKTSYSNDLGIALLFIDLDGFKLINDTLGHAVGDMLLNQVAQRLTHIVDESTEYTGFISRLGGDEFTVILHPESAKSEIENVTNAILTALAKPFDLEHKSVNISASIGCVFYPKDAINAFNLVQHADLAMYKAKQNGKNSVAYFSPEMINEDNHSLILAQELRQALNNESLIMHFQPRVNVKTGEMIAVEALMRWFSCEDNQKVHAYPDQFVPLAEKMGLISQLDTYALHYSCKQAALWQAAGHALVVSVNISVKQLQQENFVDIVKDALLKYRLEPSLLELEITESAAVTDVENSILKLLELKNLGIRFSIDDFGTGYSSLSYLKRLPIDNLKIDRSFITDISHRDGGDSADATIVRTIVALGKSMGFGLVAEGIETVEQALFVESLDCDQVQGYLYSKPKGANEISQQLQSDQPLFDLRNDRAA